MKILELFSGIGGAACALGDGDEVVGALDISSHVLEVYALNHAHPTRQVNLGTISYKRIAEYDADTWWMSPPCQPYTVRGHQDDLEDHRAKSLIHLMGVLERVRPERLALENVAGFSGSRAEALVVETLERLGYTWRSRLLCPTELGVPARRERFYLVASLGALAEWPATESRPRVPLARLLDESPDDALWIDDAIIEKHGRGMRILDLDEDPEAVCNTFTSAYQKTWRSAGSFLRVDGRVRFFSHAEIMRTLGFPEGYAFPAEFTSRQRYKYIGNSLSVHAVREVLTAFA